MRSKPLGLLAAGILLAACGRNTVEQKPVAESTFMPEATPKVDTDLPQQLPVSTVDPATAKSAWVEGVAAYENGGYAEAAQKLEVASCRRLLASPSKHRVERERLGVSEELFGNLGRRTTGAMPE